MIGEVVKLGFDGSAVHRGLGATLGGFRKLGRGISATTKQIGTGVARQAGHSLFGTIMKGVTAIPNEINNLSALNKEIKTMGMSTGIAADRYLALREAISKTTGLDEDEASDFVKDVSERLGEAMTDFDSTPRKAMMALGIRVTDIKDKNLDEQLKIISKAFKDFQATHGMEKAMFQINELLGEVGKKMAPLFLDYDRGMNDALDRTRNLTEQIKKLDGELEGIGDIKSAFRIKFSELSLGFLSNLKAAGLDVKSIASFIRGIDVTGFSKVITDNIMQIKNDGLWGWIKAKLADIGSWLIDVISTAIKKGIKGALPGGGNLLKMLSPFGGSSSGGALKATKMSTKEASNMNTKMIEQNTARSNVLLERITDGNLVGRYA